MKRTAVTTALGAGFLTTCYLAGWALGLHGKALNAVWERCAPKRVDGLDAFLALYPHANVTHWKATR